jgi:uncharacterized membrane protein YbhN (UPF0104 family)
MRETDTEGPIRAPEQPATLRAGPAIFQRRGVRLAATAVTVFISAAILGWLVYSQREVLLSYDWRLDPWPLALSFLIFSVDLALVGLIWGWIMNALGGRQPLGRHLRIFSVAYLSRRLPGTIWYVASRAQLYKAEGVSRRLTSLASGVEFAISILSSVLVSFFFAVPILTEYRLSLWMLGVVLLLGIVVVHPRFIGWLLGKLGVQAQAFSYRHVVSWLAAYCAAWVLSGAVLYLIGLSFVDLAGRDLWYIVGSLALVNLVSALLLFAPSNLGVTEVGLSLLLANIMPAPLAVVLAVGSRVLLTLYEIFWAMASIWF